MIDIHIIPNPGFEENLAVLQQSLEHPRLNIHLAPYITGNILEARYQGFSMGNAPYVTWADGDDGVLNTDWVDQAIDILDTQSTIVAVYPRWKTNTRPVRESPPHTWNYRQHLDWYQRPWAHHLTVCRREPAMKLMQEARLALGTMVKGTEHYLIGGLMRYGDFVALDNIAYEWRHRSGTARNMTDTKQTLLWCRRRMSIDMATAGGRQVSPHHL